MLPNMLPFMILLIIFRTASPMPYGLIPMEYTRGYGCNNVICEDYCSLVSEFFYTNTFKNLTLECYREKQYDGNELDKEVRIFTMNMDENFELFSDEIKVKNFYGYMTLTRSPNKVRAELTMQASDKFKGHYRCTSMPDNRSIHFVYAKCENKSLDDIFSFMRKTTTKTTPISKDNIFMYNIMTEDTPKSVQLVAFISIIILISIAALLTMSYFCSWMICSDRGCLYQFKLVFCQKQPYTVFQNDDLQKI
ncbi:hypothetical protein MRV_0015 [Murid herpesvirus 3]|uniref:Uncharacterized protein n=2 Tax=Murid betaherpesvirus 3 TaxID=2560603 RepID=A0A1P8VIP6_9BETA|nr:hypothetical protein MRV_0015 [Murine roseolovirus]APZ76226.1 hypothetical protein MRV_0015 [Murid betaherpesvirus 3]AYH64778.1 hypothetical protein MRV_0015 [Murid herpesvirus 3]